MTVNYKLVNGFYSGQLDHIQRNKNGVITDIPINEQNRSYQEYLEWLAEGNTPLPADDPS